MVVTATSILLESPRNVRRLSPVPLPIETCSSESAGSSVPGAECTRYGEITKRPSARVVMPLVTWKGILSPSVISNTRRKCDLLSSAKSPRTLRRAAFGSLPSSS